MINRILLSMLLAILLLFAQQQALVHPYQHSIVRQQNPSNHKNTLPHTDICAKCTALASVACAIGSKSHVLHVLPATFALLTYIKQLSISAHFQAYQSRAPPYLA